jgi:hypothetical protein
MKILGRRFGGFLQKLIVTLFGYLSYFAGVRPYLERNFGNYIEGLVDGVVLCISFLIFVSYIRKDEKEKPQSTPIDIKDSIDARFLHLVVHYSQRTDSPDTPDPARPRYLVNSKTRQAYWVPTWMESIIRQKKLAWNSHDGEKALSKFLKENKIQVHNDNPMPADLGLDNSFFSS